MQRRDFVKTCTGTAFAVAVPSLWQLREPIVGLQGSPSTTLRDTRVKALALSALDAAHARGAHYADVRLTNTTTRRFFGAGSPSQRVDLGMSIRALVNGYWGWAATPSLSPSEAVRIGQLAVELAKIGAAHGKPRTAELGTVPSVHDGDWTTPITIDPFDLKIEEAIDWMAGLQGYVHALGASRGDPKANAWRGTDPGAIGVSFYKQERLFASTEGSLLTQTVVMTEPHIEFMYRDRIIGIPNYNFPVQAGWERISETPIREGIRQAMDRMDYDLAHQLPRKPVDVGRYDIVFSADAVATLLTQTLAPATELDRALGSEANVDGTSYLGPHPLALLGTAIASPLVTVTADRSTPTALATVKWDDEGVASNDFPLIKSGVLVDYQTTREQAAWLAPWYEKAGVPIRSHGCAMAPDALAVQMQHTPNLIFQPGTDNHDVDDLVAGLEHGLLVERLKADVDFQCNNGEGILYGVTEIRNGKRVSRITEAGMLFRSSEFWKNIQAVGGAKSVEWKGGFGSQKGNPWQNTPYSVATVPVLVKQLAIIDPSRKA